MFNENLEKDKERLLTALDVAEHYLTPKARQQIAKQIPRGEMKRIVTTIEFFSGILDELLNTPADQADPENPSPTREPTRFTRRE